MLRFCIRHALSRDGLRISLKSQACRNLISSTPSIGVFGKLTLLKTQQKLLSTNKDRIGLSSSINTTPPEKNNNFSPSKLQVSTTLESVEPLEKKPKSRILKIIMGLFEVCCYLFLFFYTAQYAAFREDNKYAMKCYGHVAPLLEEVLETVRENPNITGFLPSIPTKKDMYNLLFEANALLNFQYTIHSYNLYDNAEYYSDSIAGMYKANRIAQCMDLMTEYLHLLLSAAIQLGYLTEEDYKNFEKHGCWKLPCVYIVSRTPSYYTNDKKMPHESKTWYRFW